MVFLISGWLPSVEHYALVQFQKTPLDEFRREAHLLCPIHSQHLPLSPTYFRIKNHADDFTDTFSDTGILSTYNAVLNNVSSWPDKLNSARTNFDINFENFH